MWAGWIKRRENVEGFKKIGWARCPGIVFIFFFSLQIETSS